MITYSRYRSYRVIIDGTPFEYVTGEGDDAEAIIDKLVLAINGGSLDLTASKDGTELKLEADNSGDWFSIQVQGLLDLSNASPDTMPSVVADLNAIQEENADWFAVYPIHRSTAELVAIAAWVESRRKLMVVDSNDTDLKLSVDTDVGSVLQAESRFNSSVWYHSNPDQFMGAALLAAVLPLDPGSETWAYKTLRGVAPDALTSTERTNLLSKNVGMYVSIAGRGVTREGKVASGEWLDKVRGIHWLQARLSEDIFELLTDAPTKIPYTNAGAEGVRGTVQARLENAVGVGFLSDDPAPVTTVPNVNEVPEEIRKARKLPDVKFTARVAGAIHTVDITGYIGD